MACNEEAKNNGKPVARVNQKFLYSQDLQGLVPGNSSPEDSASLVRAYLDNWIRQMLVLDLAEKNLPDSVKDVDKQLEDYRNSLIRYRYEQELVRQKLDTIVSEEDLLAYYDEHQKDFQLKNDIIKVFYIKVVNNEDDINYVKKLYRSENEEEIEELKRYCYSTAENFFFDDDWLFFDDLLKEVPIKTYNKEQYLKNHRFVELKDSQFSYFLNIKGFRIKDDVSPLSFESNRIRSIIINKRKLKLIEEMENKTYRDALLKQKFELYEQ